jgi:hypothetical protein
MLNMGNRTSQDAAGAAARVLLLIAAIALLAGLSGCGTESYANNPKAPAVRTVAVFVGEDEIAMSPNPFDAGPTRFVVTNQTGTRQNVTFSSDRIERKVPVGSGQTENFKMTTEPGYFSIDADNTAANSLEIRVGPTRPSAQQDLNQP